VPPGVRQDHQRQQAGGLAVRRQQAVQHPGEPDGLGRELDALQVMAGRRGVTLVEDEVQHVTHGAQAFCPLIRLRKLEPHPAGLYRLLGPADPLGHRRLGNEKGAGDLGRRQPADRAQRQRDLRRGCEHGMAAQEQQRQGVVVLWRLRLSWRWLVELRGLCGYLFLTGAAGPIGPDLIDQPSGPRTGRAGA